MPDFKLTPGQNHMLTHFIQEEKWKYDKARQIKKAQYRKEKRGLKSILPLKSLRTFMLGTAHPPRKIKISARCAFIR